MIMSQTSCRWALDGPLLIHTGTSGGIRALLCWRVGSGAKWNGFCEPHSDIS